MKNDLEECTSQKFSNKMMVDCKTVGFFLKISKEIGKAWRKSLLFDCSRVLEYAKIRTVLQSKMMVNRRISVVFVYMQMTLNCKCFLNHLFPINRSQLFSLV